MVYDLLNTCSETYFDNIPQAWHCPNSWNESLMNSLRWKQKKHVSNPIKNVLIHVPFLVLMVRD